MKLFNYNYFKTLKPLTNYDILNNVNTKNFKIKNFRGVFMRDSLPSKPLDNECGIVNLDSINNKGTHWVCYFISNKSYYFDSFGLFPPKEVESYLLKNSTIIGSSFQLQDFNTDYCGYFCLYILEQLSLGYEFENIILLNYEILI